MFRRLSAALTLGAALVAITACSTPGSPTASAPTTTTEAMPAPAKLLDTVKTAAASASAVHIKGFGVDTGNTFKLDVQLNKDGSAYGTVAQGNTTIPLVVANNVYYMQFTSALMSSNGIDPKSAAGVLLLNKWVPSTAKMMAGSGMVAGLKPMLDYNTLLKSMLDQAGTSAPTPAGTDTVDSIPVHVYADSDGSKVDIATASPHYVIRVIAPKGQGQLDFTGWGEPVKISPPPANQIYSGPGA